MFELLGWIGVLFLLLAYGLMTAGKIRSDFVYHLLNLMGAGGVMVSAIEKRAWPAAGLEIAWMTIAIIGIYLILRKKGD